MEAIKHNAANVRYIHLNAEVNQQINILQLKLKKHNRKQIEDISNYGFVGDMAHLLDQLKELNSFIK